MFSKPPLLIVPVYPLSTKTDVELFDENAQHVLDAKDDQVVSFPYPVVMYQRIDGIWLPVSDLGAFHSSQPTSSKSDQIESNDVPDSQRTWIPCDDDD